MPYRSRVYRQRNANMHDDTKQKPFFGNQQRQAATKTAGGFFQARLTVNEPGDRHEHEADAVADQVVNKPSEKKEIQERSISSVQRLATSAEDEKQGTNDARMAADKEIQEKPEPDSEEIQERRIQKQEEQGPATAVQPGGPFDRNDQTFTLNWKNGEWEGCGPVPGTAAGGENACVSSDSIDQIKNYFKKKPVPGNVDRPVNCPPERWNFMFSYCCGEGKHVDPNQKSNCIPDKVEVPEPKIEKPEAPEKGDFEIPDGDTKMA